MLSMAIVLLCSCVTGFAAEKVPVMNVAGKVVGMSDGLLIIERSVKGKTEVMEFVLEKPVPDIVIGEQLKVSYRQKETKNILLRAQKAKKAAIRQPAQKGFKKFFDTAAPPAPPPGT